MNGRHKASFLAIAATFIIVGLVLINMAYAYTSSVTVTDNELSSEWMTIDVLDSHGDELSFDYELEVVDYGTFYSVSLFLGNNHEPVVVYTKNGNKYSVVTGLLWNNITDGNRYCASKAMAITKVNNSLKIDDEVAYYYINSSYVPITGDNYDKNKTIYYGDSHTQVSIFEEKKGSYSVVNKPKWDDIADLYAITSFTQIVDDNDALKAGSNALYYGLGGGYVAITRSNYNVVNRSTSTDICMLIADWSYEGLISAKVRAGLDMDNQLSWLVVDHLVLSVYSRDQNGSYDNIDPEHTSDTYSKTDYTFGTATVQDKEGQAGVKTSAFDVNKQTSYFFTLTVYFKCPYLDEVTYNTLINDISGSKLMFFDNNDDPIGT